MSKQHFQILDPSLKANISFENEHFVAKHVTYHAAEGGYLVEGTSEDGRRRLIIFSPTIFDVTKTYKLVPYSPKDGEARVVFYRPTSSIGYWNFHSDRGTLSFIAQASGLHGVFNSFSNASPGNFPDTQINGSFQVRNI
ncbi:hypothetical protein [Pseudomonas cremoris]|uniref:hypothetical protein n=2 Tax=Gammaproteobacteria TaxID=1236 RepID=UPI002896D35A|nr:hypothetical protein [Pseudomonas cremoris]